MKTQSVLFSFALASLSLPASAASVFIDIDINDFENGTGVGSSSNGSLNQTARTTGSNAATTYQITNVDLTSIGGTAAETINFTVSFANSSGTVNYKSWGDAYIGGGNTEVGETFRADFGTISTSYGDVSFVGFTNAFYGALQAGESAATAHDGGTINTNGPATNVPFSASSFVSMSPTSGAMNISGFDLQIAVVPEPSSAVFLGLAGCSLLLLRRRA